MCLTLANKTRSTLIGNGEPKKLREAVKRLLYDESLHIVTHTGSYDLTVIHAAYSEDAEITDGIWEAYRDGRIHCTKNREKLLNLSTIGSIDFIENEDGSKTDINYSLADLGLLYLDKDRSNVKKIAPLDPDRMADLCEITAHYPEPWVIKSINSIADTIPWRLSYKLLDGWKAEHYPPQARDYALEDARDTFDIFVQQDERAESKAGEASCARDKFDTAVDFALRMSTVKGIAVDREKVLEAQKKVEAEVTPEKLAPLYKAKLLTRRPARPHANQVERARAHLVALIGADPIKVGNAEWGDYQTVLVEKGIKFVEGQPDKANQKLLREKVEILSARIGIPCKRTAESDKFPEGQIAISEEVINDLAPYDPLLELYHGRQKMNKLLTTYLPPLLSSDVIHPQYDVLKETGRTSSFGGSERRPSLFPSVNIQQPHPWTRGCYTARPGYVLCSIDYNYIELVSLAQKCYSLFGWSTLRDKINAGMDPHAFLGAQLGHALDPKFGGVCRKRGLEEPDDIYAAFMKLKDCDHAGVQELFKHYRTFAKPTGLGFPGGLGPATFIGYAKATFGVDLIAIAGDYDAAVELATQLRELWRTAFPEVVEYFRWVREQEQDTDGHYAYVSPFGLYRNNASYCACANGAALQSPAADGAKLAVFDVSFECYHSRGTLKGAYLVAFLHDECLFEMPEDAAPEMAFIARDIMVSSMQQVITDVKVSAKPALMRHWSKAADSAFDDNNRLICWEDR